MKAPCAGVEVINGFCNDSLVFPSPHLFIEMAGLKLKISIGSRDLVESGIVQDFL